MATTKVKPFHLFVPFSKIERRAEDDALIVEGYCFVNPTVKGDRYSIKRSAMEAATAAYMQFPAVREMHQPIAAGTGLEVVWDERGCLLRSECVDDGTKKKIDKKVLRGYSIGVTPTAINRADEVEALDWLETSYVDRPKDPDAVFLYRAEGFDPDAEIEAELLDEPVSTDASRAEAPSASSSSPSDPSGEDLPSPAAPSVPSTAGEGFSPDSPREQVRAALAAAGLEALLESVDVVDIGQERAQTSATVPSRENLEGKPKKSYPDMERYIKQEGDKWCVYSESGEKLGEHDSKAEAEDQLAAVHANKKRAALTEERYQEILGLVRSGALEGVTPEESAPFFERLEEEIVAGKHPRSRYQLQRTGPLPTLWHFMVFDEQETSARLFRTHEEAAEYLAAVTAPAVEPAAPAEPETETVSRSEEREDASVLDRLATIEATLERLAAERESAVNRATAAEAQVRRLEREAVPQVPVIRNPQGVERRFLANLGGEGEAAIAVLRADYEAAKKEAEAERHGGDRDKLNRATERMILRASQLAEHGIYL